jgi:tRNA(fMet)-specific endonuclease VapC
MYLLDTDHISLIQRGGEAAIRIGNRLAALPEGEACVSVVSYEEQVRGWTAEIARTRAIAGQEAAYDRLLRTLDMFCLLPVLPFDGAAITEFQRLWLMRLRVGTLDLKIAAISLANDATLLTRNTSDFARIPGLRFEDWSVY